MRQFYFHYLILAFFVLLSFLNITTITTQSASNGRKQYPPINLTLITKRCRFIVSKPMHRFCTAKYPKEIKIKYKDQMIQQDTPFSVFVPETEELSPKKIYMITFRPSKLHRCPNMEFKSPSDVLCREKYGSYPIELKNSQMHCFPFHLQLIRELVLYCLEYQGSPTSDAGDPNARSMLHYNDVSPDQGNAAEKLGDNVEVMRFLIVIALLVLFCI